jgi:hypothetical protein
LLLVLLILFFIYWYSFFFFLGYSIFMGQSVLSFLLPIWGELSVLSEPIFVILAEAFSQISQNSYHTDLGRTGKSAQWQAGASLEPRLGKLHGRGRSGLSCLCPTAFLCIAGGGYGLGWVSLLSPGLWVLPEILFLTCP